VGWVDRVDELDSVDWVDEVDELDSVDWVELSGALQDWDAGTP
jgi:acyl carrier protein